MDTASPSVDELIAQLSLHEKVAMLSGGLEFWDGMNRLLNYDYYHKHSFPVAANERLGIPGLSFIDGPRGVVVYGGATTFPVTMARGATWNPVLEEAIGDALATELRLLGGNLTGAVCINLLRHPAWGRAQETYGEDTVHLSEMGASLTRGIQRHAIACVKHYALNSMENARFTVDVQIDDRALHEVYLPHFKACVDAGAQSVMSAYNSVNGEWAGQNRVLLNDILKGRWGFAGFVLTDFIFGVRDGEKAIRAGLDLEMPFPMVWGPKLERAVRKGKVDAALLDDALKRVIRPQFGLPDITGYDPGKLGCQKHRDLALEAAVQSMVLLKNDDVDDAPALPVAPSSHVVLLGRMAREVVLGDKGSSDGRPEYTVSAIDGLKASGSGCVSQFDTLEQKGAPEAIQDADAVLLMVGNDHHDEGEFIAPLSSLEHLSGLFPVMPKLRWLFDNPLLRPVWRMLVRCFLGLVSRRQASKLIEEQGSFGRGGDRTELGLKRDHLALVEAACEAHPRVIVALVGGSAILMEEWRDRPAAILMTWYAGQEGGNALADLIYGRRNPSGKLPFTIPREEAHLPYFDKDASAITYDLWHGYRKLQRDGNTPAFPFGFGLSYTRFEITFITAERSEYRVNEVVALTVAVKNTGNRDGDLVLQIYSSAPDSEVERGRQELKAFARLALESGESRSVELIVPVSRLAYFSMDADDFVVEPTRYTLTAAQYVGDHNGKNVDIWVVAE